MLLSALVHLSVAQGTLPSLLHCLSEVLEAMHNTVPNELEVRTLTVRVLFE